MNNKNDFNSEIPANLESERVPTIIKMAAIDETKNETTVKRVNDNCCIVERKEMKVVGIKTVISSASTMGFISIAEKYIKDGTIDILEKLLKNKNPGRFIGISTNIKGGGNFEYIIGIEVDDFDKLPEGLPEDTGTCICNSGIFAKMNKIEGTGRYELWEYFIGGFREETDYVYDKNNLPYQVFNKNADLIYAYEPVKIPKTEEEKYDSINYKIVTLPAINFAGVKSNTKHGMDIINEYFSKYMNVVDQLPNRKPYIQNLIGFGLSEDDEMYSCFGAQVLDFENLPEGINTVALKGGLYVHLTQLEINDDNPAAIYSMTNDAFFKNNPLYQRDGHNCDIVRFHLGHSASIYIPIKKEV